MERITSEEKDQSLSVAILIDELRSEDVAIRLASVQKLQLIAKALGPQRTKDELIPYLSGTILLHSIVCLFLADLFAFLQFNNGKN